MSNWKEQFDKEFIATGADIEGMKRVEYRQLREHQIEQVKDFIQSLLDKKDEEKRELAKAIINEIPDEIPLSELASSNPAPYLTKLKQQLRDKWLSQDYLNQTNYEERIQESIKNCPTCQLKS